MKLYTFRTVPLSIIRSLFTVPSAMVYVIQICRQLSSRTRMEKSSILVLLERFLFSSADPDRPWNSLRQLFTGKKSFFPWDKVVGAWICGDVINKCRCASSLPVGLHGVHRATLFTFVYSYWFYGICPSVAPLETYLNWHVLLLNVFLIVHHELTLH